MADISKTVDKIIKLPVQQKVGIVILLVALLAGGYYYGIHKSLQSTLQQKNKKLTKLNADYSEQKNILANRERFKKEYNELQKKFANALKLLPNSSEIPKLLTNISELAHTAGLEILLFQPMPELAKNFYAEIPVKMEVKGRYHDLAIFFDKVSKLNRIVNISDIAIKSARGKDEIPGTISASFQALTFKFIQKSEAQQTDKRKKRRRKRR